MTSDGSLFSGPFYYVLDPGLLGDILEWVEAYRTPLDLALDWDPITSLGGINGGTLYRLGPEAPATDDYPADDSGARASYAYLADDPEVPAGALLRRSPTAVDARLLQAAGQVRAATSSVHLLDRRWPEGSTIRVLAHRVGALYAAAEARAGILGSTVLPWGRAFPRCLEVWSEGTLRALDDLGYDELVGELEGPCGTRCFAAAEHQGLMVTSLFDHRPDEIERGLAAQLGRLRLATWGFSEDEVAPVVSPDSAAWCGDHADGSCAGAGGADRPTGPGPIGMHAAC